jgi:hypothetical protein
MGKILAFIIVALMAIGGGLYLVKQKNITPVSNSINNINSNQGNDTGVNNNLVISPTPDVEVQKAEIAKTNQITLKIISPTDGATVSSSSIVVKGITSPFAEVFVNDSEITADKNGNFSVNMAMEDGDNYIVVVATDPDGNSAETEINLTYTAPTN